MNERTLERLDFSIDPFTVTEKDSFCPRDVKEGTLGLALISIAFGAPITLASYVDVGDPTLVTVDLDGGWKSQMMVGLGDH